MTFSDSQAMFNENVGNIYNAQEFRRNYQSHTNGKAGVLKQNDYLCSLGVNTVSVATGSAYVRDSSSLTAGQYFARTVNDVTATILAVTPNNTVLARNDLVTLRILDTAFGDASNNCSIIIETGVAVSAFPRSLVLASFTVAAAASSGSALVDTRQFAGTYQGVQRCTSTTRPTSPSEGDFAYETNTDAEIYYDGSIWKRTGDQIPHSNVSRVIQTVGGNSTTIYAAMPTAVNLSFTKHRADTTLIVDVSVSFRCDTGVSLGRYGIFFSASTTEVLLTATNTAADHRGYSGSVAIAGVAAGFNTYSLYWRHLLPYGVMTVDSNDQITLKLTETL